MDSTTTGLSCDGCGVALAVRDGVPIDPSEVGNDPDLCLLNEPADGQFGPHTVTR